MSRCSNFTSAWMLPAMTRAGERLPLLSFKPYKIENVFNWVKLRVA